MLPVLLRAASWRAVLGLTAAGAVTGGLAVGARNDEALRLALVLVGAAAACALDDAVAAVVDCCPARRSTQVLARALAASVAGAVGLGVVLAWWVRSPVERVLLLELLGCWVLGFSLAVLARSRLDEPGEVVASGYVLVLLSVLLFHPLGRHVVLFPDGEQVARGVHTWWTVIAGCAVAVVAVVRARRWHPTTR